MSPPGRTPMHNASTTNLYQMLQDANRNPQKYAQDATFVAALKSQGSLAKYTNAQNNIIAGSINTLKRVATTEISGGFPVFEIARTGALAALQDHLARAEKANRSTKAGQRAKIEELEEQLLTAQRNCWQLTKALNEAMQDARSYAKSSGDPKIMELCKKEQRKLLRVFALFVQPDSDKE